MCRTGDPLRESRIQQDHEHQQHIPTFALILARGAAYAPLPRDVVRVEVGVGVKSAFRSSAIRTRSSRLILGKCFRCYAIASRQARTAPERARRAEGYVR